MTKRRRSRPSVVGQAYNTQPEIFQCPAGDLLVNLHSVGVPMPKNNGIVKYTTEARAGVVGYQIEKLAALCLDDAVPTAASKRHIEVTCGVSRTPMVGRCPRERRLNRSAGRQRGETLTGFVTVTGRRGLLTRPSLFLRAPPRIELLSALVRAYAALFFRPSLPSR